MKGDINQFADQIFTAVQSYVAREFEARAEAFKHVVLNEVAEQNKITDKCLEAIEARLLALPVPKDGERGEAGPQGTIGPAGEKGERGEAGLRGEMGPAGPAGPRGERGESGKDVDPALVKELISSDVAKFVAMIPPPKDGERGPEGPRGERGPDGIGIKGDPGADGKSIKGDRGDNGKSAYELAVEKGFDGTEKQWLASLSVKGEAGPAGPSVFEVAKAHGFSGSELDWLESLRGKQGPTGENGRNGYDAVDGRDALEIDVMDGIDESRSYPRGTFATFNGGTFRAARATDPLKGKIARDAGWQCVFRGVSHETEEWEDSGRFITKTITYSDGTTAVSRKQTAIPVYRGVYQAGKKYLPGDGVTFDGGQWTAKAETSERPRGRPPGEEQVWQLSLKAEVRSPR